MSGLDQKKNFLSLVSKKKDNIIIAYIKQTDIKEIKNLKFYPNVALQINPNFVQYVTDSIIVFISGCNVILYDFNTKKQKFLMKKTNHRRITFLSVGSMKPPQQSLDTKVTHKTFNQESVEADNYSDKNELKDKIICLGEYSDIENIFYLTFIKPSNTNIQYTISSTENFYEVNFCSILNNTHYCVSISQKNIQIQLQIIIFLLK